MLLQRVGQGGPLGEQRRQQLLLHDGADDLGGHDVGVTGARLDDRHLGDAVLAQDLDGLADGLLGVHVDEGGDAALLVVEHVADAGGGAGLLQEAVSRHPLVAEDLAEVAAAAVRQQDDDDVVRAEALGGLQRGHDGHAAGAADEEALLLRQAAGHLEGVLVGHRDDLVGDVGVVGGRPEVLADALDEVRTAGAAGVDRALGVGADDLDLPAADLLEVVAGTGDRAARADARDEVGDLPVRLLPQLRTGGLVVRTGVVRVAVLVGLPGAGLAREAVGHVVVRVRVLGVDGGRADHDLGAVRAHHVDLVHGHLVRADEDALVALLLGHDGESYTRVAAGRLHDGATGLEGSALLGGLDHPYGDPVLHGSAGIEVLDLRKDGGLQAFGHTVELHQRGVADEADHRVVELHHVLQGGDSTGSPGGTARVCRKGLADRVYGAGRGQRGPRRWPERCRGREQPAVSRRGRRTAGAESDSSGPPRWGWYWRRCSSPSARWAPGWASRRARTGCTGASSAARSRARARCGWACWVIPRPPGSVCGGPGRLRPRCWPRGSRRSRSGRWSCATWPCRVPCRTIWTARWGCCWTGTRPRPTSA